MTTPPELTSLILRAGRSLKYGPTRRVDSVQPIAASTDGASELILNSFHHRSYKGLAPTNHSACTPAACSSLHALARSPPNADPTGALTTSQEERWEVGMCMVWGGVLALRRDRTMFRWITRPRGVKTYIVYPICAVEPKHGGGGKQ